MTTLHNADELPDYGQGIGALNERLAQLQAQMDDLHQHKNQFQNAWAQAIPKKSEIKGHIMDRLGLIDDAESPMNTSERQILDDHVNEVHAGMHGKPLPVTGYYDTDHGAGNRQPSVQLNRTAHQAFDVEGVKTKMNAERTRRGYSQIDPHAEARSIAAQVYKRSHA